MWDLETSNDGRKQICRPCGESGPLPYGEALSLWESDASFRDSMTRTLAGCSFPAFRWETPPLTVDTLHRSFEFVLLRSDALERKVDPTAFATHIVQSDGPSVVSFANLRGDATLVVPVPRGEETAYGHLASFARRAPHDQAHELWKVVGRTMKKQISSKPVWLSTAGMGVSWLHVRLDSRPKYYGHRPYTQIT